MSTIVNDLVSHLQCGEAISANDAVYIDSSDGKIYKFTPTDDTQVFAGIAKEAGVLNDFIRVVQSGRVKGFTGLTPGQFVYASVTVPGSFQLVEPASSQKVILGIAKSATELTINGGLGIKPGGDGSGGGLDAFYIEDMEGLADVADFATGNNASFLGGGTLQGALALESASPISGLKSLKYTQAAGSLNDYFASELIEIDPKQQDNTSGMTLYFTYDGNDNDGRFVVWDETNSQELAGEVNFVKIANKATRYSLSFYVPASCTQIRWGYQVLVENIGAELVVDDVEMSTDPFVNIQTNDVQETRIQQAQNAWTSRSNMQMNLATATQYNSRTDIIRISDDSVNAVTLFTALRKCTVNISGSFTGASANSPVSVFKNSTLLGNSDVPYAGNTGITISTSVVLNVGDTISFRGITGSWGNSANVGYVSLVATAASDQILTPSDTFSTDTAPLTYAGSSQYNLSTLANAPIGTFITFTYAINTNTRTQTNAAPPTQSTSDMNQNGIQIFTRAYNAASTAGNPAAIAIQIGKGLKGKSLDLYKSTGKSIAGSLDYWQPATNTAYGTFIREYNESTGILLVDLGFNDSASYTVRPLYFSDYSTQTNGYLTINASKALPLLAVPVPQVAYLKDVKPSGTGGGTFTAGSWQTRTLNTVEGDSSIVSLNANQFTLGPGKYEIEATAPAYNVNFHKAKIRNITDSTDSIIGMSQYVANGAADTGESFISGVINITSSKTFELQHRCSTTATDGFGRAVTFGDNEVYTQLKIVKKA